MSNIYRLLNFQKNSNFRHIRKIYGKDWGRPAGDFSGDLSFQQIDLDKVVDYSPGEDPRPVIRIFGSDKNGSSVACFVQNFRPYFYVPAPSSFTDDYCGQFQSDLNHRVMGEIKNGVYKDIRKVVLDVELCMKENIYGYSSKGKQKFLKVTVALWTMMSTCKKVLEGKNKISR